ncbi:ATP-dependent 6-phosphofructokinase [Nakamurella sp. PAMC28650]|jgi:6-phosphofructokinase 1|uniref:ATP-dependent 6-phosphofructokinase n=1 Tax=Nakamurella sp. PAMC28650 TaxID=2762325 RepID=UPI00164E03E4|nr:ATP-dependent 6-phosphofructokinase [Nakamurella sp. PAMC28650]QNK81796.1 ATP-dependent 6-phosphofructokinase [Nakamurella sp. PAMC28650]
MTTTVALGTDLKVSNLGECRFDSPLAKYIGGRRTNEHYVDEDDRVLFDDTISLVRERAVPVDRLPSFEPGGPRRQVFFAPGTARVGVVTCGGLCPGLNDVIRGLVLELCTHYGVGEVTGFRYGYAGLVPGNGHRVTRLTPDKVDKINEQGGTILGTSRGAQDPEVMADTLVEHGIDILFVIGGDGSMRGAAGIAQVLTRRGLPIGVIGIPKTIDNDIPYIGQSFGFQTSFTVAAQSIQAARVEAQSAIGGVGLVRVMGRHSGFIACYAALANHDADFVLIPEVPFALDGDGGFLACLRRRVTDRGSAVVVVAEGAGQELLTSSGSDASGNAALADVGVFMKERITSDFEAAGQPLTLKYIDPGYAIRSVPAQASDSVYCVRLAQAAVHAAMAGRTDMVVGRRHNRFIHVPISLAVSMRNRVAPDGDLWLSILESTAQPFEMR